MLVNIALEITFCRPRVGFAARLTPGRTTIPRVWGYVKIILFISVYKGGCCFAAKNLAGIAWAPGLCKKSFAAYGGRIFF